MSNTVTTKRDCGTCANYGTIDCPSSDLCLAREDKPFWEHRTAKQARIKQALSGISLARLEEICSSERSGALSHPLSELAAEIHQNAKEHGWWDEPREFGTIIALCHSELSEALEEHRNGNPMVYYCTCEEVASCADDCEECEFARDDKPEGVAVEMIDCMIRILDWCGKEGLNVDAILEDKHLYNKTRPYKHGGKKI